MVAAEAVENFEKDFGRQTPALFALLPAFLFDTTEISVLPKSFSQKSSGSKFIFAYTHIILRASEGQTLVGSRDLDETICGLSYHRQDVGSTCLSSSVGLISVRCGVCGICAPQASLSKRH